MTHTVLPGEVTVVSDRSDHAGGNQSAIVRMPGRRSIIGACILLSMTGCASFQGVFNEHDDRQSMVAADLQDSDGDGVVDSADQCATTLPGTEISSNGCGVLDRTLRSRSFDRGAAQIDVAMRKELDVLAEQLALFPDVRIAIEAHTDGKGSDDINVSVSRSRALAVRRYLLRRGTDDAQMDVRYFGESLPIADNNSEEGRALNRRVAIVTLPVDVKIETGDVSHLGNPAAQEQFAYVKPTRTQQRQVAAATTVETMKASVAPPVQTAAATVTQVSDTQTVEPPLAAAMVPELAESIQALPAPAVIDGLELGGIVKGLEFVSNSAELYGESYSELDNIASQMDRFPSVSAILLAHVATLASPAENLELSNSRAGVLKQALQQRGIDGERIDARGYGDTLPLVQALSEEDQETNSRIEIRVVEPMVEQ